MAIVGTIAFLGVSTPDSYDERGSRMTNRALIAVLMLPIFCLSGLARPVETHTRAQSFNSCIDDKKKLLDFAPWDRERIHEELIPELSNQVFFFVSGMTIDADGAPNAYHPDDLGIDELTNAGRPGHWDGVVTDRHGIPMVQREADPYPGYYISCTSLADKTKELHDPARYVDATKIPYVALPAEIAENRGVRLGDFAYVSNLRNGKSSFAIYADIGTVGEGSVALAEKLGISPNARHGGESDGILYMFFPGSGNRQPRTLDEIQSEGKKLLFRRGAIENLYSCSASNDGALISDGGL